MVAFQEVLQAPLGVRVALWEDHHQVLEVHPGVACAGAEDQGAPALVPYHQDDQALEVQAVPCAALVAHSCANPSVVPLGKGCEETVAVQGTVLVVPWGLEPEGVALDCFVATG